jgi:hypothetical protein
VGPVPIYVERALQLSFIEANYMWPFMLYHFMEGFLLTYLIQSSHIKGEQGKFIIGLSVPPLLIVRSFSALSALSALFLFAVSLLVLWRRRDLPVSDSLLFLFTVFLTEPILPFLLAIRHFSNIRVPDYCTISFLRLLGTCFRSVLWRERFLFLRCFFPLLGLV